jgi:hypothetical protein
MAEFTRGLSFSEMMQVINEGRAAEGRRVRTPSNAENLAVDAEFTRELSFSEMMQMIDEGRAAEIQQERTPSNAGNLAVDAGNLAVDAGNLAVDAELTRRQLTRRQLAGLSVGEMVEMIRSGERLQARQRTPSEELANAEEFKKIQHLIIDHRAKAINNKRLLSSIPAIQNSPAYKVGSHVEYVSDQDGATELIKIIKTHLDDNNIVHTFCSTNKFTIGPLHIEIFWYAHESVSQAIFDYHIPATIDGNDVDPAESIALIEQLMAHFESVGYVRA